MNAAMTPGNDILTTTVHVLARCPRCEWRFIAREGDKYCPDCTNNPLWDRDEEAILARKHPSSIFKFMGWTFGITEGEPANVPYRMTYLFCWKRLFNPEKPNAVYSQANFYHNGYDPTLYRCMPERLKTYRTKECAAWLIAHWWEHYLEICPCLHGERDDEEDSNFRHVMIESLLWYDEHLSMKVGKS